MHSNNPWLKMMLRNDRSWHLFWWVLAGLGVLTVVLLVWLHMLDYPFGFFETVPGLLCIPVLILAMMMLSVTGAVVKRETRSEAYQLVYLTNFPAIKVVWALMFAMVIRLRVWVALFVWAGAVGMTTLSVNLAAERLYVNRFYSVNPIDYLLPSNDRIIIFAVMWLLAAVSLVFMLMSSAIRNGLRGVDPLWGALRSVVTAMIIALLGYGLMLVPLVSISDTRWFGIITLILLVMVLYTGFVARNWGMLPRFGLDVLASDLFGLMMVWLLLYLVGIGITDNNIDPYYTFVTLYVLLIFLTISWLRMMEQQVIAGMILLYSLEMIVLLLFLGLTDVRNLLEILLINVGVWVIHGVMLGLAVLTGTYGRHSMPLLGRAALISVGLQAMVWVVFMEALPRLDKMAFFGLVYTVIIVSVFFSLVYQRCQYGGLRALMLLMLHLLLPIGYLLGETNLDALGDAIYATMVWAAILAIYTIILRNIYNSVANVWNLRLD